MGSDYERELRDCLSAEPSFVTWALRQLPAEQAEAYRRIGEAPFLVLRAAGSFGCDLVALRRDVAFPVEVKSSVEERIHFASRRGRDAEQAAEFAQKTGTAGVIAIYAFRLKGVRGDDPWRVFALPLPDDGAALAPRVGILYRRLPKVGASKNGNLVLRWGDGMPLHKFIDYLCPAAAAPSAAAQTPAAPPVPLAP